MRSKSCVSAAAAALTVTIVLHHGSAFVSGIVVSPSLRGALPAQGLTLQGIAAGADGESAGFGSASLLCGAALAACAARCLARRALGKGAEIEEPSSRRSLLAGAGLAGVAAIAGFAQEASAEEAPPNVDVPDRISEDPFVLVGLADPDNEKEDKKEFYMKKKYRQDTYQLVKHMKISGSLDKGTPNMEKWNKRVKEEMNDWIALYRRQDLVVGRQSYYSLYSAVNTLASHFTSYGPKFPFPNKRRPRFFELINTTEKYLEKGK
mmetsp:Transcript_39541/g.105496  ORF Transcript_39541/g.105496 Transcript_39541/m.105496 type:complete len:264 (-) Transcript_39541:140-931(-)